MCDVTTAGGRDLCDVIARGGVTSSLSARNMRTTKVLLPDRSNVTILIINDLNTFEIKYNTMYCFICHTIYM